MTYNNKIWVLFFKFTVLDNRSPKLIRCTWWGFFLEAQQGNGPHASSWLLLVDNNSWHGWTLAAPLISTPSSHSHLLSTCDLALSIQVFLQRPVRLNLKHILWPRAISTQLTTSLQRHRLEMRTQPGAGWTWVWEGQPILGMIPVTCWLLCDLKIGVHIHSAAVLTPVCLFHVCCTQSCQSMSAE